jgi:hypothetical protein
MWAGVCFHQEILANGCETATHQMERDAAQTVAAHLGLRAVRVDHTHARMRRVAFDQENTIGADAAMSIAQCARVGFVERCIQLRCFQCFYNDEVVSETLVLGKLQRHGLGSSITGAVVGLWPIGQRTL